MVILRLSSSVGVVIINYGLRAVVLFTNKSFHMMAAKDIYQKALALKPQEHAELVDQSQAVPDLLPGLQNDW